MCTKKVKLNRAQINQLISDNYVILKENKTLEIHKETLLLNINGVIYDINAMDLKYVENEFKNNPVVSFLQNLLCMHLNLAPTQVIFSQQFDCEYEFKIRFAPNNQSLLVVCENRTAASNVQDINDNLHLDMLSLFDYIGPYKRLGDSSYYFRWFSEP